MAQTQAKNDTTDHASSQESCAKRDTTTKVSVFLSSFIKAKKDLLLYPATNPVVTESLEKMHRLLQESFGKGTIVEFLVEKDHLLVNGGGTGENDPRASELSLALYKRGIRRIVLDPNIPFEEMRRLIEMINMKAEEIAEAGGIVALARARCITHAELEGTAELTIVDGAKLGVPEDALLELEQLEDMGLSVEQLGSPESFSRTFVRVEEGDFGSMQRLRALLGHPSLLSALLEKFSLQLEKVEGDIDPTNRVERMLEILQTVGAAIASLPSQDERAHMFRNLAVSVLGLSANLRTELVNQGLVPNLALKSIESGILSRFPTTHLADALLENFEVRGAAASVMQSYFSNLDWAQTDRSALAEIMRARLNESEMLTPEVDAVLTVEEMEPDTVIVSGKGVVPQEMTVPQIEGYPPEMVLFHGDERTRLINQISEELSSSTPYVMAPALLELLRHEKTPVNHATLIERATSYIDHFLETRDFESAAALIQGLQGELQQKKQTFSLAQLKPLKNAIEEYLGEERMRQLVHLLKNLKRESSDFEALVKFFDTIGAPAIETLVRALEDEESRHVRLLICQALARISDKSVAAVAAKISHAKWYVARNAVSILGQIGKPECIPHLRRALRHKEIRVKKEALKALASIRTDEAIDLVCQCVEDSDISMCKAALEWTSAIEAERALPALERLLDGKELWKRDNEVIRLATEALASIGTQPAADLLERLTQTHSLFRRKKAALIRKTAGEALHSVEEQ